jgi:hypothetical protein
MVGIFKKQKILLFFNILPVSRGIFKFFFLHPNYVCL